MNTLIHIAELWIPLALLCTLALCAAAHKGEPR
jgi:hypothetical protein